MPAPVPLLLALSRPLPRITSVVFSGPAWTPGNDSPKPRTAFAPSTMITASPRQVMPAQGHRKECSPSMVTLLTVTVAPGTTTTCVFVPPVPVRTWPSASATNPVSCVSATSAPPHCA